jgi:lysozyme
MPSPILRIEPTIDDPNKLMDQLKRHEGLHLSPYRCSANKLTIGIGRNLDSNRITKVEAEFLAVNDINRCIAELRVVYSGFEDLNQARKYVLVDMCFNLGMTGLLKFKRMWAAIHEKKWSHAAEEMLDSKWARQVGVRSRNLAQMMVSGELPK